MKKGLLIFCAILLALSIGCSSEANEPLPEVPEEAIKIASEQIEQEDLVEKAHVEIDGDRITLVLVVNAAANEETAKRFGDNFARLLSTFTSTHNSDANLESPSKDYIGGLWDHYNLDIGVGTGPDNFIAQGAKIKGAPRIVW